VIKWIFERCSGTAPATEVPIGYVPTADAIDVEGLDLSPEQLQRLLLVDSAKWKTELDVCSLPLDCAHRLQAAAAYYKSLVQGDEADKPVPADLVQVLEDIRKKL
jgi:hypothetical protein